MPIEKALAVRSARVADLRLQLDRVLHKWPSSFTLEIGCGHGHFLAAYATAHPDEYCLGIDIVLDRLARAQRKVARAQALNADFLRAEAGMFLEILPESYRLNKIYVLFPDPWPKRRHHKNRLLSPAFFTRLTSQVTPGARVYFRTDHEPYFEAVTDLLKEHPTWQRCDEAWPFEHPTVFQNRAAAHYSCIAKLRVGARETAG